MYNKSMWSNKKTIDVIINALLFLVGLNFMYIGQFILPVICLIILIDNRFRLHISNKCTFILICLFSLTYWLFSIRLGLYGLISFCLPMCYYIGSNLKDNNKFKNAFYSLTLGMAFHLVINMFYEFYLYDLDLMYIFSKSNHYDIWLNRKVNSTLTALNSVFLISVLYYVIFYEKDILIKRLNIFVYALALFYSFALGRRTTPVLILISLFSAFVVDLILLRKNTITFKSLAKVFFIAITFLIIIVLIIDGNYFGIKDKLLETRLFQKIISQGLSSGRLELLLKAIEIAPKHLWGGREILNETGSFVHDLWGDIYDYAGIIPYFIMIIISIICFKNMITFIYKKEIDSKIKVMVIPWFICFSLITCIEPLMSGGTIFLFSSVIVISMIEKMTL